MTDDEGPEGPTESQQRPAPPPELPSGRQAALPPGPGGRHDDDRANHPGPPPDDDAVGPPTGSAYRREEEEIGEARRRGRENMYGDRYQAARAHTVSQGPGAMAAEEIYIGCTFSGRSVGGVRVGRLAAATVGYLVDTRIVSPRDDAVRHVKEALARSHVVNITGPDGTGRYTTAVAALRQLVTAEQICVLEIEDGSPIPSGTFKADHGYIIDAALLPNTHRVDAVFLESLRGKAEPAAGAGAFVVVVSGTSDSYDAIRRHYVVPAGPPPPAAHMLAKHVEALPSHLGSFADRSDEDARHCLHRLSRFLDEPQIAEELLTHPAPRDVYALAAYLVDGVRTGRDDNEILGGLISRIRKTVCEKVARPFGPNNGDRTELQRLRRRSFLISSALLNGLPLAYVAEMANLLTAIVQDWQRPDTVPDLAVFEDSIEDLLEYVGAEKDAENRAVPMEDGRTPVIRFQNPREPAVILDVIWHYNTSLRAPLLTWLQCIAENAQDYRSVIDEADNGEATPRRGRSGDTLRRPGDDARVRVCAAQAVGKLASTDPDYVYRRTLEGWAARKISRQAAAWALETTAEDPRVAPKVRQWVRQWARSRAAGIPRTALLAYGTHFGEIYPADAIQDITRMAEHAMFSRDWAVATAVRQLYQMGIRVPTKRMLNSWRIRCAEDEEIYRRDLARPTRHLGITAARCMVLLADIKDSTGLPEILMTTRTDLEWGQTLYYTSRRALVEASVSGEGWRVVQRWIEMVDEQPDIESALKPLLENLVGDPYFGTMLRQRMSLQTRLWRHSWKDRQPAADRLLADTLRTQ